VSFNSAQRKREIFFVISPMKETTFVPPDFHRSPQGIIFYRYQKPLIVEEI
jgi:hypothetical protein